jgi:large conductance mechanosensitive channel
MPRLNDRGEEEDQGLLEEGAERVKYLWEGFIDFALQGNILEIAFGLMYASSHPPKTYPH